MSVSAPEALLRHRPFAQFWLVRVCTTVAMQIQAVAVGWQIYTLTSNPLDLGLVGLAQFLPALVLFPLTGHAADRYDRRQVLRICLAVEALAVAALAWGTFSGWISREAILGIAMVLGAVRAFEQPSLASLLPTIVPDSMFPRAVAGSASANQIATIAGPAAGGLIYALNPVAAYVASSALFFTAGILVALIPLLRPAAKREPFSIASMFAGFAFIRGAPVVLGAIMLDLFAVLLGGATALMPVFARDILHTDAEGLGLLRACPAVGALTVSLVLARWPMRQGVGRIMYACVAVFGIATIVFSLSQTLALSMAALVVLGAADLVSVVIRSTLVQLSTPDEMRGRVSAVNSLFIGTSNQLGEFRAGVMAAWLGAVPAVLIGGVGTLLIVAVWTRVFPELFRVDEAQPVRSAQPSG
ncbi:MAG: MFS transporter [Variibacter sp.]|nr:MFS transporter [Variibacter sp.]